MLNTPSEIIAHNPWLLKFFEALNLDRDLPLEDACRRAGLKVRSIQAQLGALLDDPAAPGLGELSPSLLVDHIVSTHHEFLRDELPRLQGFLDELAPDHADLAEVRLVFRGFCEDMFLHMQKEERMLFPAIVAGGQAGRPMLPNMVAVMLDEHRAAEQDLLALRALTQDYSVPEGAAESYRALMNGLAGVEEDTHRHVFAENCVLFPKALQGFESLSR